MSDDLPTRRFLEHFFQAKPDDLHVLIWTLPGRQSHWVRDVADAEAVIQAFYQSHDVYIGVGYSPDNYGIDKRCKMDLIAGIPGLWADLDCLDPVHKETNLPPTLAAGEALLAEMGLPPSVITHSGHGLQAWWFFKEPWIFDDATDRQAAATLADAWARTLQVRGEVHGWHIAALSDLARVLRIPGTSNRKNGKVKPVTATFTEGALYDPSDFDGYLLSSPLQRASTVTTGDVDGLILSADRYPPARKLNALIINDPTFKRSWTRNNPKLKDQSASGYDLSMANIAVQAGWSDQEIADLMIGCRVDHNDSLHDLRPDYYQRTINLARSHTVTPPITEDDIKVTLNGASLNGHGAVADDEHRKKILEQLGGRLGVVIEQVIRFDCDPPEYAIVIHGTRVHFKRVDALIDYRPFRAAVATASGHLIPTIKAAEWNGVAQLLLRACEDQTMGGDATDRGQAETWLTTYIPTQAIYREDDDMEEAALNQAPFEREGVLHIFGSGLRKWLDRNQGEKINARDLGRILRAWGATAETVFFTVGGKPTTRYVWKCPLTWAAPSGKEGD